jgi:hypothetical protein
MNEQAKFFKIISDIQSLGLDKVPVSIDISECRNKNGLNVKGAKGKLLSCIVKLNNLLLSLPITRFQDQLGELTNNIADIGDSQIKDPRAEEKINQIKEKLNEIIRDVSDDGEVIDKINQLKNKLPATIEEISEYQSFFNMLTHFNLKEIKELANKLAGVKMPSKFIDNLKTQIAIRNIPENAVILLGYLNQNKLDSQLGELRLTHNPDELSKRIIITTSEVVFGLDYILSYLRDMGNNVHELAKKEITAQTVLTYLPKSGINSCFELAWGLLDSLIKHNKDNPYVTTSFQVAEEKVSSLAPNSTLVIDGHGGMEFISCGDYKRLSRDVLSGKLSNLILADKDKHIDHCILQSCRSGRLDLRDKKNDINLAIRTKSVIGKSVAGLVTHDYPYESLFEKDSMSTAFTNAISTTKRDDIAFSFSENLINPSHIMGGGNLGIPALQKEESRHSSWPDNVSAERTGDGGLAEERQHWKRCTIATNEKHRKLSKFTFFESHKESVTPEAGDDTLANDSSSAEFK